MTPRARAELGCALGAGPVSCAAGLLAASLATIPGLTFAETWFAAATTLALGTGWLAGSLIAAATYEPVDDRSDR